MQVSLDERTAQGKAVVQVIESALIICFKLSEEPGLDDKGAWEELEYPFRTATYVHIATLCIGTRALSNFLESLVCILSWRKNMTLNVFMQSVYAMPWRSWREKRAR